MIARVLQSEVKNELSDYPVVTLTGLRQVGKTTLAKEIADETDGASLYLDLELPEDRLKLKDIAFFLRQFADKLVILDEIQLMPEVFPVMRALIDQDRRPGRFLLLGSSSPSLVRGAADSLAGRVAYAHLNPFELGEVGESDQKRLWLRGGLPRAYLARSDRAAYKWMRNYITSYVQRDLPQLGIGDNPVFLDRLLRMLAHFHGQLINYDQIAKSLQVSGPTIRRYVELLEQAFIIFTVPPHTPNIKKRLVKSPKIYFTDSGILHALLGIKSLEGLLGHPQAGASWEGFVIAQIRAVYGDDFDLSFYRTYEGAEVDLVMSRGGKNVYALEIKMSDTPNLSRGYYANLDVIGAEHNLLITPGSDAFLVRESVGVTSLVAFLAG